MLVKEKLGIKQICPNCEAKFYDLGRNPAVCPKCEYNYEPEQLMQRSRGDARQNVNSTTGTEKVEETSEANMPGTVEKVEQVVTLEEADAETADVKRSGPSEIDDDSDIETDSEVEDGDDHEAFDSLDEDDDFREDVTGIID